MTKSILLVSAVVVAAVALFAFVPQDASTARPADKSAEAARLNNLGAAYMNQQLFEKALKAFEQAATLDPKLTMAQVNQGIALLNLGRIDSARPVLEQAVKQSANDPSAWYNWGLLYKNTGDSTRAVEAFRRVTEIDPQDADTWYFLGASYAQDKQYSEAMDAFQHALKLNPLHASAEFGLSRAYQQSADLDHAREHLQRFLHITQNKLGSPISLAYGEQGKYSLAEESPVAPQKVPPAIKVRFVDVTYESGLPVFQLPGGSEGNPGLRLGPGACWLDYDGDGRVDLFLPGRGRLYHNFGGKFEDVTTKSGLKGAPSGVSCTVGDYDNDGFPDLVISSNRIALFHNEKDGTFRDVTESAGMTSYSAAWFNLGVTFVDYDHDGDLDLYVTRVLPEAQRDGDRPTALTYRDRHVPNVMWRNNGNGTFTDVTNSIGVAGMAPSLAAIGTDFNNDRAVDLVLTQWNDTPNIYENPREGKFLPHKPWAGPISDLTNAVAVLDFDHDGWMDLAFTHWGAPGLTLWRNHQGKAFEPVTLPTTNWVRGWGVAAIDYDNDGWLDLVAVGETAEGKGEVRLFRNLGPDGFKDVTADVGLDKIALKNPRAIITGDYDNDGATDLLITQNHGPAVLLRNEGGNQNRWLRLSLKGLADNKSAIGTKVEVFSAGLRQKF